MKKPARVRSLLAAAFATLSAATLVLAAAEPVNVTQHHNHATRDGLFVEPAFTREAAAHLQRDTQFDGTIEGQVYAQPLYLDAAVGGKAMVIVATEWNNVYALDAITGKIIWQRNVGAPVNGRDLPCGNVNPLGITGTPIMDLASRSLFFDAMTTPDGGKTKAHLIFALDADSGAIRPGWPVDVSANPAASGGVPFKSDVQSQRAALAIVGGTLYVPYGGHYGDCGDYHGRVVGVPLNNPQGVEGWATAAKGGGIWGVGGIASDGKNPFVVTGNTSRTGGTWGGGEAVIRLQSGPVFSADAKDYWAPPNWANLDSRDADLGGSGAMILDVPGATPSALVLALGKDGKAYLLDRANLGGIANALVTADNISHTSIIQAAVSYRTARGTYVVFRGSNRNLTGLRIEASNPPTITKAWEVDQSGYGSPFATTTGKGDAIVWLEGAEGDERLHGFDGDTGETIYDGAKGDEPLRDMRRYSTGIVARGRIYLAGDRRVYAFKLPDANAATK